MRSRRPMPRWARKRRTSLKRCSRRFIPSARRKKRAYRAVWQQACYYFWEDLQKTNNAVELITRAARLPTYIVTGQAATRLVPEEEGRRAAYADAIGDRRDLCELHRSFPRSQPRADERFSPRMPTACRDIRPTQPMLTRSAGRSAGPVGFEPEIDCRMIARTENEVNPQWP